MMNTEQTVISQLEWTGTVLRIKKKTFKYKSGLLMKVTEDSNWTTIDEPTLIKWS